MVRSLILPAFAAIGLAASPVDAAVIASFTHDYGRGQYVPQGDDRLRADYVAVRQTETRTATDFLDSFDFSGLIGAQITALSLALDFTRAAGSRREVWYLDLGNVRPDGVVGLADDLLTTSDTLTRVIDASSTGTDATVFSTALRDMALPFSFDNLGQGERGFRLASASLTVSGIAAVPLPAPFWLLLSGLGALAVARRRAQT